MERLLLTEYLSDGVSKREMYQVILQFVDALIETESTQRQVVLQLDRIEIYNGKVEIQYESGIKPLSILRITDFVKELIFRCVFRVGEELEDLADFLRFLDNEREVTLAYIYEYVADELEIDIPQNRQSMFEPVYPSIEPENSGETGVLDVSFWEQNKALREADKIQRNSQELFKEMKPEQTRVQGRVQASDETGLLDASFWDNKLQNSNMGQAGNRAVTPTKKVSLVNIKNGEETMIARSTFVVGKDPAKCDLVIQNKTISRTHAEIIIKGSKYYVKDLGSTNKTFVDNKGIVANVEVEIFAGTRIKFSNEMYELVVK